MKKSAPASMRAVARINSKSSPADYRFRKRYSSVLDLRPSQMYRLTSAIKSFPLVLIENLAFSHSATGDCDSVGSVEL